MRPRNVTRARPILARYNTTCPQCMKPILAERHWIEPSRNPELRHHVHIACNDDYRLIRVVSADEMQRRLDA